jgi:hypothetical protein
MQWPGVFIEEKAIPRSETGKILPRALEGGIKEIARRVVE